MPLLQRNLNNSPAILPLINIWEGINWITQKLQFSGEKKIEKETQTYLGIIIMLGKKITHRRKPMSYLPNLTKKDFNFLRSLINN